MNPETKAAGEELLQGAATQAKEIKAQAQETLHRTKAKLADAQAAATYQTRRAMEMTDTYVHENTWQSIGIAAGVGFIFGLLVARR